MTTLGSGTVARVPYIVMSAAASRFIEVLTMPDVPLLQIEPFRETVFIQPFADGRKSID